MTLLILRATTFLTLLIFNQTGEPINGSPEKIMDQLHKDNS